MPSELTERVFEVYKSRPKVAILMSGTGTNARALLDSEEIRDLYQITVIASDNSSSNAGAISQAYGLNFLEKSQGRFNNGQERVSYFEDLARELGSAGVEAAFYAGFMKISTQAFTRTFPGVNIHPADLTITNEEGSAKYRGMRALSDMRRDLGYVRSTVHVADTPVDSGSAIALSEAIYADSKLSDEEAHNLLKIAEHRVYPETLIRLAKSAIDIGSLPVVLGGKEGLSGT